MFFLDVIKFFADFLLVVLVQIEKNLYNPLLLSGIQARRSSVISQKMTATETQASQDFGLPRMSPGDVQFAKCECCGLTEECTEAYIKRVRERFQGRWICGLCAEAVKDEVVRSQTRIGKEEALNLHMSFCKKFRSLRPPPNPTEELISAVKQLLLRTLDSPKKEALVRPKSC